MADNKVTFMVLKVDLQCPCCYKKVKKLLCKFPQIRDQVYDEKQNTVTISVLCCSPEKIQDKLCCKGGKVIQSIEIKSPPKPKEPEKPKLSEKPKEPEKPKAPEKPKEPEKPKAQEKPKEPEKAKSNNKPLPSAEKPTTKPEPTLVPIPAPKAPQPAPRPAPEPVPIPPQPAPMMPNVTGHGYPSIFPYEPCCGPCSQGQGGGPCYQGHGRREPNCYDNYYGYINNNNSSNYGYGEVYNVGGRPCYTRTCDYPYGDNTSSSCTIM